MVFRFLTVSLAVFLLAACARPGTGIKDNFALRDLAATSDTKIFLRNPRTNTTGPQMRVILNGAKVATLGGSEAVALNAVVGENTLKAQYVGLLGATDDGASIDVSLAKGQKRFFIARYKFVNFLIGNRLEMIEISREAFLSY